MIANRPLQLSALPIPVDAELDCILDMWAASLEDTAAFSAAPAPIVLQLPPWPAPQAQQADGGGGSGRAAGAAARAASGAAGAPAGSGHQAAGVQLQYSALMVQMLSLRRELAELRARSGGCRGPDGAGGGGGCSFSSLSHGTGGSGAGAGFGPRHGAGGGGGAGGGAAPWAAGAGQQAPLGPQVAPGARPRLEHHYPACQPLLPPTDPLGAALGPRPPFAGDEVRAQFAARTGLAADDPAAFACWASVPIKRWI